MSWRVANALDVLLAEINAAAPDRSKVSDGSIGDAAHASRESDHNPWVHDSRGIPVVRARDFTHDPAGGLNCHELAAALADLLREGRHPALRSGAYVIWDHQIISCDRLAEGWRPYSGSNPHTAHLHLSVALAQTGYDSTARWGITREEDDMFEPKDRALLQEVHQLALGSRERERQIRLRANQAVRKVEALAEDIGRATGQDSRVLRELRQLREDVAAIAPDQDAD